MHRLSRYPLRRIIAAVTDAIRMTLEVQVIDESLIGLATATDGTTREFAGWLGLLSVLEALLPSRTDDGDAGEGTDLV